MSDERREHSRKSSSERVVVNVVTNDSNQQQLEFECNSRDFSAKGVRLHGHTALDLNCELSLIVHSQVDNRDYSLTGKVMWATETTEHEHLMGVQLSDNGKKDYSLWQSLFPS